MNLLLLSPDEVADDGTATLRGRRLQHLVDVLDADRDRVLKAGLIDGPLGEATVIERSADAMRLSCRFDSEPPALGDDTLLLAVPRPKVLRRCLEAATALGFGRIVLMRTWCTDKSHLGSRALEAESIRRHLILGLEQGRRTRVPEVSIEALFKPFVEDRLDALLPATGRFVAHPEGAVDITAAEIPRSSPISLAIGPERGFTSYEVQALSDQGFTPLRSGTHPLKVETALPLLYGQLTLLRA